MTYDDRQWMARCMELLGPLWRDEFKRAAWGLGKWRLHVYAALVRGHLWLWRRGIEL